jgi:hypothetical protein
MPRPAAPSGAMRAEDEQAKDSKAHEDTTTKGARIMISSLSF